MSGLLAVPIRSGARVLGVMLMLNKGGNEVFTDRDKTSTEVSNRYEYRLTHSHLLRGDELLFTITLGKNMS